MSCTQIGLQIERVIEKYVDLAHKKKVIYYSIHLCPCIRSFFQEQVNDLRLSLDEHIASAQSHETNQ